MHSFVKRIISHLQGQGMRIYQYVDRVATLELLGEYHGVCKCSV